MRPARCTAWRPATDVLCTGHKGAFALRLAVPTTMRFAVCQPLHLTICMRTPSAAGASLTRVTYWEWQASGKRGIVTAPGPGEGCDVAGRVTNQAVAYAVKGKT